MAAIQARNFQSNSLSGVVSISNGFANVVLSTTPFALEGDKSFVIKLRRGSIQGDVVATSPPITVQDNSSFVSLTANTSSVNEGNLVSFTLVTANAVNGATLFYSVNPVTANLTISDFYNGSNTGYLTLNNNQATFALYANTDSGYVDETGETFRVQLRTDSITGNVVYASTSNVVIIDTNKLYNVIGFTESSSSVTEGGTIILTFTAHNVPAGTIFYYSTEGNTTTATFASANTGSFVMNGLSNTISLVTASVPYGITQNFNVKIREGSPTGTLLATSNNLIVVDPAAINYMSATGGTIVDVGGYRTHTFTTSGNLTVSSLGASPFLNLADYLVVAGGGAGSGAPYPNGGGGGGGAGGLISNSFNVNTLGNTTIVIGAGGVNSPAPANGSNTTITGIQNVIAVGGGAGAAGAAPTGQNGGSGGGAWYGGFVGAGYLFPGPTQQGYPGGAGVVGGGFGGGGGGGAGQIGGNATSPQAGNGGNGFYSLISGANVAYAGGGGGGGRLASGETLSAGGAGGGGRGGGSDAASNNPPGVSGNVNTGGGGGGGGPAGGAGGSGVVIIRYPYVGTPTVSNVVTTATAFIVGSNITFTINATNANTTTLYYTTDGNVNTTNFIGGNTGSFVANASGGIVTLQSNTNIPLNESRSFRLQIRQDSTTGFISGSSANVTIEGFAPQMLATGGNVITADGYRIHTFLTSNTFVVSKIPQNNSGIEYLIVGGGGGGGDVRGGGGGAGGYLSNTYPISAGGTYTITVGAGGAGGFSPTTAQIASFNGSNSIITGIGTAFGGGRGRPRAGAGPAFSGGSGGGGGADGSATGASGTPGQGNPGGNSVGGAHGGGGGGAGAAGSPAVFELSKAGDGGIGKQTNISGSNVYYAGGGGGDGYSSPGIGGLGGGGSGNGLSGNIFTGGGGGGGRDDANGGPGGSGIVIIRYPYS